MGWPKCNQTLEFETIDEDDLPHGVKFHHVGLVISAFFGLTSIFFSWYLIWRHATHYLKPWEQKHIIRILFMVPIYSTVSFLSYLFYRHAVYFEVLRDCYEAFAIASFFSLLCHYIAPDLHSQKDYFRGITAKNWVLPINWLQHGCCGSRDHGLWRIPKSGLTWFNIIWLGIFQYCFIRVFMTLVAVITEAAGIYCLESLSPAFAHIWVMVIEGVCVSIAMYCIIQFYVQVKEDLSEHRPLLKVAAIKLVIFLSFWQTLLISFLTSSGAIKASKQIQTPDIKIGIPAMLLCIEMAIFSVFHLWAFPWQPYDIRRSHIVASESAPGFLPDPKTAYQGGVFGTRALAEAFNPWDIIKNVGRAFRWAYAGRRVRHQDISYKNTPYSNGANNNNHNPALEPTRNQFTAFNSAYGPSSGGGGVGSGGNGGSSAPYDGPDTNPYAGAAVLPTTSSSKTGHYTPLSDTEDDDRFVPQPLPPQQYGVTSSSNTGGSHNGSSRGVNSGGGGLAPPYPLSPASQKQRSASGGSARSQQDVGGGHGRSTSLTPDPHPLGPPGRKSHEQEEWEEFDGSGKGGRGESERDLGGGHGVRDNRF